MQTDFGALAGRLLSQSRSLLPSWFPKGKLRGREFVIGNLQGDAGDSLSINLDTGAWKDFAGTDKGGDLISLYAAIHGIKQGEAAKILDDSPANNPTDGKKLHERQRRNIVVPVPDDAAACPCKHYKYGLPVAMWEYRNEEGKLTGYVARYEPAGERKQIIPWTYAIDAHGKGSWGMGQWPAPRALFGIDDLALRKEAAVLVVEGEKCAVAARKILPQYVCITWPGGAAAWQKSNFKVLAGRHVLLWPDADEPGIRAMWGIGHTLLNVCKEVKMIFPDDRPDGWDAADAIKEDWDWDRFKPWASSKAKKLTEGMAAPAGIEKDQKPAPSSEVATVGVQQSQVSRWLEWGLDRNGNGVPVANLNNAVGVLENDPTLKNMVWFDSFLQRILTGDPAREWQDADDVNLTLHMQRNIGIEKMGRDMVQNAVIAIAYRNMRNCVRDWMESLEWDQVPRIDKFFEDHFGATGTRYCLATSRNFWISMVARALHPGCKVDNVVILEGGQGIKKSTALSTIAGDPWFTEQHESVLDPKRFAETIQGKLLIEITEMDSFGRAESTRVKAAVTNRSDRYREAYGRYAKDHPRQCIFVVTTNRDDWNKDETGARRFWPIRCSGDVDIEAIRVNRSQLFAEAVEAYKNGATWWEMPADETKAEQRKRYDADPWLDAVADFVGLKPSVTVNEILEVCMKLELADIGRSEQMRVATCLRALGWYKTDERIGSAIRKVWRNGVEADGF